MKNNSCASAGFAIEPIDRAFKAPKILPFPVSRGRSHSPKNMKMNTTQLKLDRRLGTYLTLGVGAGVLGSQSSNAAIVYWDVTPVTATIGQEGFFQPLTGVSGLSNPGGSPTLGFDFQRANYVYSIGADFAFNTGPSKDQMSRLASNAMISAALTFKGNWSYIDNDNPLVWTTVEGPWATGLDGTSGFVGFRFDNAGTDNYGWIAITYNDASQSLEMGDFAYEDSGASILAGATGVPEPSSLALLVLGATGVLARRRRETA